MQIQRLADIHVPTTLVAELAAEAAVAWCSRALMEHNHRAYLWAAARGTDMGIAFDEELLYVAAMFHDIGLVPAFDNATRSFDEAGGNVAWMFAAGAGWPVERRVRLGEVIVRHMWDRRRSGVRRGGAPAGGRHGDRHLGPRPCALGPVAARRDPRGAPEA